MKIFKKLLLLVMVLILSIPASSEAESARKVYYPMSAQDVVTYVKSSEKRKVIFIYTSWCAYCKEAFPQLIELERRNRGSVFAVSVDEDVNSLRKFLKKYDAMSFHPLWLKDANKDGVEELLAVAPRTGVPHFILLDEQNHIEQRDGVYVEDVVSYITGQ